MSDCNVHSGILGDLVARLSRIEAKLDNLIAVRDVVFATPQLSEEERADLTKELEKMCLGSCNGYVVLPASSVIVTEDDTDDEAGKPDSPVPSSPIENEIVWLNN